MSCDRDQFAERVSEVIDREMCVACTAQVLLTIAAAVVADTHAGDPTSAREITEMFDWPGMVRERLVDHKPIVRH